MPNPQTQTPNPINHPTIQLAQRDVPQVGPVSPKLAPAPAPRARLTCAISLLLAILVQVTAAAEPDAQQEPVVVDNLVSTANWGNLREALDDIAAQANLTVTYDHLNAQSLAKINETKTTFSLREKRGWRFVLEQILDPIGFGYFQNEAGVVLIVTQADLGQLKREYAAKRLSKNHTMVQHNVVDGTPLREVVETIAEQANIEISYGFFSDGTNVPPAATELRMMVPMEWRNVLQQVLDPAGYDFVEKNGFVLPMPQAQAEQMRASMEMAKPLVRRIFPISYADVDDLIARLKEIPGLLSSRGRLLPSQTANGNTPAGPDAGGRLRPRVVPAIVAIDVQDSIDQVEAVIHSLDHKEEQILIEARVIDVMGSGSETFGFLWDTLQMARASAGGSIEWGREVDVNNSLQTEDFRALNSTRQMGMSDSYTRTIADTYGEVRSAILGPLDVSVVLDALKVRDDTELLSHPVVVVGNRSEAEISIETIIDVARVTITTLETAAGPQEDKTEEVEEIPIGINLWVLPEIAPSDESGGPRHVRMSVRPRLSDLLSQRQTAEGTTLLTKSERVVFTRCSVPSGHTLLLGGLTKTEKRESESSVPLLGQIPIIGRLFRHNKSANDKSNLIILITPTILDKELPETDWETMAAPAEIPPEPPTPPVAPTPFRQASGNIPVPSPIIMRSQP